MNFRKKKYFLYLFVRNYQFQYASQFRIFYTKFMCRYCFLCELITHTLYFCYLFSFLLFLSFFSLHFFWFYKSNIHNKCGIWSHLRKGCYKRISCPKFEFVMYFKNSWFLEKNIFYSYLSEIMNFNMHHNFEFLTPNSCAGTVS